MRLFVATGVYPPESGGPATHTKFMEERLPREGFTVEVLPFRVVRHLPPGVRHIAYFFLLLWRSRRADVLFAQDTMSVGLPAAVVALCTRIPLVIRVPGDWVWEQSRTRWGVKEMLDDFNPTLYGWKVRYMHKLQGWVLNRAVRVVCPSQYLARFVQEWGVDPRRITVIPNGIMLPVPTAKVNRPEGFFVVSASRRVPWKGVDALERVCAQEGWKVYIAERDERSVALGWVASADVFVLNSSYEGLSHTLIEAMSLGVPIVATHVGGNTELIHDGIEGLLIPPQDDEALRAAITRIQSDPALAKKLGDAAKTRAQSYAIERTLPPLVALLRTL